MLVVVSQPVVQQLGQLVAKAHVARLDLKGRVLVSMGVLMGVFAIMIMVAIMVPMGMIMAMRIVVAVVMMVVVMAVIVVMPHDALTS